MLSVFIGILISTIPYFCLANSTTLASEVLHKVDHFFFPCWLTLISIILECIIIRRLAAHEPFPKLCVQATVANTISAVLTPFIIYGADSLFSLSVATSAERICYYACIPFPHYFIRCFVSPLWFMSVATISDTVIEAPILWFFFNRKAQTVSTKKLWLYVLVANILTNGIAVIVVLVNEYYYH